MSFFKDLLAKFTRNATTYEADQSLSAEARRLFDEYLSEAQNINAYNFNSAEIAAAKAISESSPDLQLEILMEAMRKHTSHSYSDHVTLDYLEKLLLKRSLPLNEEQFLTIFAQSTNPGQSRWFSPHYALLAGVAERYLKDHDLNEEVQAAIQAILELLKEKGATAENRKLIRRFSDLLNSDDPNAVPFAVNAFEAWGAKAISDIRALPDEQQLEWKLLLEYATRCSGSIPPKSWMNLAPKFIEKVGEENFRSFVESWFSLVGTRGTLPLKPLDRWSIDPNDTLSPESADLLKGLAWMCTFMEDPILARALGDAADASFKKVVNVGPRCPKLGNACVGALSHLKSKEAIAQLGRLESRVKHASTRATIEKALRNAASRAGMTVQELEELNVPEHGFEDIGKFVHDFGTHSAQILINGSDVSLQWFDATGKELKSVPARVKQDHADEVKAIKKTFGDVEKLIATIRHRIESSLMQQRSWKFKDLKERYLYHPIAATVARRLIWRINGKAAIFYENDMVDVQSCSINAQDDAHVELWHPIASEPEEVLAWRMWLRGHEITQPFKQAHREIYVLTPAEIATETYSNRFAAHIIRHHQFNSLCQQRGWKYKLQGAWDSYNTPYLELPQWDLVAQFFVEPISEQVSDTGIFLNCVTDQVRFHRFNGEQVPMVEIMPIVFTEVMRDVDLFVGVCSIGNDPNWVDAGEANHGYWHAYSFGDLSATAETRKQVLQEILPALKIKSRCKIEGKFLIVEGDIRTYKIHLGSGNILMEPNDEYLCIVPERGTKGGGWQKVYLPFEGDSVLSVILSKAFLLADDKKIKDVSIVRQIQRSGLLQ
jgi:hypothetical protein